MYQFLIKIFLAFNKLFDQHPHPFNMDLSKLSYTDYEISKAPDLFDKYNRFGDFIKLIKGKKVADFACGGAGKSIYLAQNGAAEIVGVDIDKNFINEANQKAKDYKVNDKCKFILASANKTPLESNYFDFVIFNDAMEHIPDTEGSIREAIRVLKPNGKIYINFEAYYFFYGHHMMDALPIPWLHLFTTESFRINLYKEAIKNFENAQMRLDYRCSLDKNGKLHMSYLNYITISKFEKIISKLENEGLLSVKHRYYSKFNNRFFKLLATLPILREVFLSTLYFVLEKNK